MLWFVAAALLLTIAMYGAAEMLASRIPRQEEYIARIPAIAPWFLAGSLFPIDAMPAGLTWVARFLPTTHALALMRYGLVDNPSGLEDIWGLGATASALLSLAVVTIFAAALTAAAVRTFTRAAMR